MVTLMRIDNRYPALTPEFRVKSASRTPRAAGAESSVRAAEGEDLLTLSGSESTKASAAHQAKIASLQVNYSSGSYTPDPEKIADALIRHAFNRSENI